MWAWIKSHKLLTALLIGGAFVLYYLFKRMAGGGGSATQDISGYGNPVVYSGGGVPIGSGSVATSPAQPVANAPAPAAAPAGYPSTPPNTTTMPSTAAAAGFTASGQPYSNTDVNNLQLPTGPGWNQGTQPTATLGAGGSALPVASGDFTIAATTRPNGQGDVIPGVWLNAQGYSSQASVKANAAAVKLLDVAKTYGYQPTGKSALSQLDAIKKYAGMPEAHRPAGFSTRGLIAQGASGLVGGAYKV